MNHRVYWEGPATQGSVALALGLVHMRNSKEALAASLTLGRGKQNSDTAVSDAAGLEESLCEREDQAGLSL